MDVYHGRTEEPNEIYIKFVQDAVTEFSFALPFKEKD